MEIPPEPDLPGLSPSWELRPPTTVISHVPASGPAVSAQIVRRETRREPNGQLVDFAVILQVSGCGGNWDDLVRIDTALRFVHVHFPGAEGGTHNAAVVPRECRHDVDLAREWAKNYAWDQAMREIV